MVERSDTTGERRIAIRTLVVITNWCMLRGGCACRFRFPTPGAEKRRR